MLAFLPTGWRGGRVAAAARPQSHRSQRDQRGRAPLGVADTVQKDSLVLFRQLGVEAQFSPRGLIGKRRKPQTPLAPRLPVLGVRSL